MRKMGITVAIGGVAILGIAVSAHLIASSLPAQDPWPRARVITPKTLAKEIEAKGKMPRIVCVGFPVLFQSAHIPGALLEGPASEPAGLAKLIEWARRAPKDSRVVIYCGCCPFNVCPNVRPAYEVLRKAGLTNVWVLAIPRSFLSDWIDKSYPVEKK